MNYRKKYKFEKKIICQQRELVFINLEPENKIKRKHIKQRE